MSNADVVRMFIAAWSRLDVEELVDYFTEDGIYHNMPIDPVQGKERLRAFMKGFLANWTGTQWEVRKIVEVGDTVIAERVDHIEVGDVKAALPCCGVFELEGGKIKAWRDYFDMATYTRAFEQG